MRAVIGSFTSSLPLAPVITLLQAPASAPYFNEWELLSEIAKRICGEPGQATVE
jgi:hypothetical protein